MSVQEIKAHTCDLQDKIFVFFAHTQMQKQSLWNLHSARSFSVTQTAKKHTQKKLIVAAAVR